MNLGAASLVALVLIPLVGGGVTLALGRRGARCVALMSVFVMLAAAASLARDVARFGPLRHALGGWAPPLGIVLHADGFATAMILTTAVVGACVSAYAFVHLRGSRRAREERGFWPLSLLLWAGLDALFLSRDLFNIYVALELVSLAAIALVAVAGGRDALRAAARYLVVTIAGSLLYLLGVALTYAAVGVLDIDAIRAAIKPGPVAHSALAAMTAGLLLKTAVFPLHAWLPPAHASAPAPASALLSALVVKASFFVLLRVWLEALAPMVTELAAAALGALGVLAVLWGSVLALRQRRLKLLLAYSTVAQLGYLLLVFPLAVTGAPAAPAAFGGVALVAVSHALAKASAFLAAGAIRATLGHDDIPGFAGLGAVAPVPLIGLALAGASLSGLPPTGGFVGKWLLLEAGLRSGRFVWAATVVLGGLLTMAYVFRVLRSALAVVPADAGRRPTAPRRSWWLGAASVALGLVALGAGPAAGPLLDLLAAHRAFAAAGAGSAP